MKQWLGALLVFILLLTLFSGTTLGAEARGEEPENKIPSQLTVPEYPKMHEYPNEEAFFDPETKRFDSDGFDKVYDAWRNDQKRQRSFGEQFKGDYRNFFSRSSQVILQDPDQINPVYSPGSLYLALSMLAEVTDGESRAEILKLLGQDKLEQVREDAEAMWNMNYSADGALNCTLANSLWLNQNLEYRPEAIKTLASRYYASVFSGEMGSESYSEDLRSWIDQQTGGLLKEQSDELSFDEATVTDLVSTVFFQGKWTDEFLKEKNSRKIFHGSEQEIECEFMNSSGSGRYYWAENFTAVGKSITGGSMMWFILPDENVDIREVISNEQLYKLTSGEEWEQSKYLIIHFSAPKFDVQSNLNLNAHLQELGVAEVFNPEKSDMSALMKTEDIPVWLSEAKQGARVAIDEEGVTAAAFTSMLLAGAGMPPDEEVEFVLDRPFLFVLTGVTGQPLFIGVVNQIGE